MATMSGMKIVMTRKWVPEEGWSLSIYYLKTETNHFLQLLGKLKFVLKYNLILIKNFNSLIREENIAVAGGCVCFVVVLITVLSCYSVPAMVSDLIESSLVGHPLEGLLFGGSPAPDSLVPRAKKAFPTATMFVLHFLFRKRY